MKILIKEIKHGKKISAANAEEEALQLDGFKQSTSGMGSGSSPGSNMDSIILENHQLIQDQTDGAFQDEEIYEMIDKEEFISFPDLAEKHGLAYVVPTNRNNETNYFAKDELREVMIDLPEFPQQVFDRDVNDPSPPLSSVEGKFIYRVIEKIEPRTPAYEEIRERVARDLSYEKGFAEAEKLAEKCLTESKEIH